MDQKPAAAVIPPDPIACTPLTEAERIAGGYTPMHRRLPDGTVSMGTPRNTAERLAADAYSTRSRVTAEEDSFRRQQEFTADEHRAKGAKVEFLTPTGSIVAASQTNPEAAAFQIAQAAFGTGTPTPAPSRDLGFATGKTVGPKVITTPTRSPLFNTIFGGNK